MKKIFRNITIALIVGSIAFNMQNVYSDVFELEQNAGPLGIVNVTVNNANDFLSFIRINSDALPMESIDPFTGGAAETTQMLGYAVFFPEGNIAPQKVYVAKKRKYNGGAVANNNPTNGGHVLYYTSNMHTERQLAIVALEESLLEALPVARSSKTQLADELGPLKDGAKIPLTSADVLEHNKRGGTYSLTGSIHIYTGDNPCQNRSNDNCNFSCIEYYNALAILFPHVHFHIYFSANKMRLNQTFIQENNEAKIALLNQLDNLIDRSLLNGVFRRRSYLQVHDGTNWKAIQGSDNDYNLVVSHRTELSNIPQNGKPVNILNTKVLNQRNGAPNALNNNLKEVLFNTIHNTNRMDNISYHPI